MPTQLVLLIISCRIRSLESVSPDAVFLAGDAYTIYHISCRSLESVARGSPVEPHYIVNYYDIRKLGLTCQHWGQDMLEVRCGGRSGHTLNVS